MRRKAERAGDQVATTIHEASLATDGSGAVFKGPQIDEAAAIARGKASGEVVVCGSDLAANRAQAREIEQQANVALV